MTSRPARLDRQELTARFWAIHPRPAWGRKPIPPPAPNVRYVTSPPTGSVLDDADLFRRRIRYLHAKRKGKA